MWDFRINWYSPVIYFPTTNALYRLANPTFLFNYCCTWGTAGAYRWKLAINVSRRLSLADLAANGTGRDNKVATFPKSSKLGK